MCERCEKAEAHVVAVLQDGAVIRSVLRKQLEVANRRIERLEKLVENLKPQR